jgi:hypothetical protein
VETAEKRLPCRLRVAMQPDITSTITLTETVGLMYRQAGLSACLLGLKASILVVVANSSTLKCSSSVTLTKSLLRDQSYQTRMTQRVSS